MHSMADEPLPFIDGLKTKKMPNLAKKREQDKRVLHSAARLISEQAQQWETHMTI